MLILHGVVISGIEVVYEEHCTGDGVLVTHRLVLDGICSGYSLLVTGFMAAGFSIPIIGCVSDICCARLSLDIDLISALFFLTICCLEHLLTTYKRSETCANT